jgi:hypothetical protein
MKQYEYTLLYGATSEVLIINPDGWNELGISFVRNEVYHGVFGNFTAQTLRFARIDGGGGEFIKAAFDTEDIKAKVYLTIKERNPQTNAYDDYFSGLLDLAPKVYSYDIDFVTVGVIDGAKLQAFLLNDEIDFDINGVVALNGNTVDAFVNSPKNILLPPIDIYLKLKSIIETSIGNKWLTDANYWLGTGATPPEPGWPVGIYVDTTKKEYYFTVKILSINELGELFQLSETSENKTIYKNERTYQTRIVFKAPSDLQVYDDNLQIYPCFHPRQTRFNIMFDVLNVDDEVTYSTVIFTRTIEQAGGYPAIPTRVNVDLSALDISHNIPPGGYVNFYCTYEAINPETWDVDFSYIKSDFECDFNFVELTNGTSESGISSYMPHEAFTRLIQLMTGELDTTKLFYSEIYGRQYECEFQNYPAMGKNAFYAITNGLLVRGFPNTPLNLSFRNLFKTFDAIHNIGLGYDKVNDCFYIEDKSAFYNDQYLMFDLGEVAELTITPFEDVYYNEISSGYDFDGKYDQYSGVYEFNVETQHAIDMPVKKKLDIKAPYNADSVGIELARRESYLLNASKDTKQDDKVYIIDISSSQPYRAVQGGSNLSGFEGIEAYYNIALTPRENLIRWGNILRIAQWKQDTLIKFISSKKSSITYRNQNGDIVNEFDDITGDELDPALFLPAMYDFKSFINKEIIDILNENPNGYIKFQNNEVTYEGFLHELKGGQYNNLATYKLIAKATMSGQQKIFEDGIGATFENGIKHIFE